MEKGRVAHSSLFLVRYLGGQKDIRISAVAPRKTVKKAVDRNKIRRVTYRAIRSIKEGVATGTHAIVFTKPAVLKLKSDEIGADLKNIFVKAGILR
jgi:ribonuclease P protein component